MKPSLALLITFFASSLLATGIPVTTTSRTGPAAFDQVGAVVASSGFDYLAAWTTNEPSGSGVYTVRVNADGSLATDIAMPLDPPPGSLPPVGTHPHAVSLTPGRDGYFLAWMSDDGLKAVITDAFGVVERRQTVPRDNPQGSSTLAAWNGTVYLVLSGFSGPFTAALFDNNGEVLASNIPFGDTHGDPLVLNALIADGAGFLALSTQRTFAGTNLYGRRMSPAGVPGDWFLVRSMASDVKGIAAAYDGTHDLIVWGDAFGLWTLQLDTLSNTAGTARQLFSGGVRELGGALWSADRLWVGYGAALDGRAHAIAVSSDGSTSSSLGLNGSGVPQLATNGTNLLSVRSDSTSPGSLTGLDAIGSFLTTAAAGADFVVSKSSTLQQNGELAPGGQNTLAVWDEIIPPQRQIFASRIGASGSLDSAGVQISSSGINSNPAAAFNGTNYLIAWMQIGEDGAPRIVARRFSPDGKVLDSADIVLPAGADQATPRVASDGTNWLVVWSRALPETSCGASPGALRIYAARVSPAGVVLDPDGVALDPDSSADQVDPDVAWNGSRYVVVWEDFCALFHNPASSWVNAGTMSSDLTHVESLTISPVNMDNHAALLTPRVAVTADRSLVAWQGDASSPAIEYRLYGSTIRPASSRQRAMGGRQLAPPVEGSLLGVLADATSHLSILLQAAIPWAPAYQGVFSSTLDGAGVAGDLVFKVYLEPSERLMGRPLAHDNGIWMPETQFSPADGAERLDILVFN